MIKTVSFLAQLKTVKRSAVLVGLQIKQLLEPPSCKLFKLNDLIFAGTFGAPVRESVPGYPSQYKHSSSVIAVNESAISCSVRKLLVIFQCELSAALDQQVLTTPLATHSG